MKSVQEMILEEFLLKSRDKDQIREFFKDAPFPAKTGYLKGLYKTGTSIVRGYYVNFDSRGIEIVREEKETFTWQQAAQVIDRMINKKQYGTQETETTGYTQMSLFGGETT